MAATAPLGTASVLRAGTSTHASSLDQSAPTSPIQPDTPLTPVMPTFTDTMGIDQPIRAEGSTSAGSSRVASPLTPRKIGGYSDRGKGKSRMVEAEGETRVKSVAGGDRDDEAEDEDEEEEEEETIENALSMDLLRQFKVRISAIDRGGGDLAKERTEMLNMLKAIVPAAIDRLPFLQERLVAQQETIRTMQQQSKLAEQLYTIERQRHAAERDSWHAETRALIYAREAEIAAGSRQRRVLDLDVGYHQELEAANKRLEMDNRLMAPRLADTQRQIDNLVNELRLLRSNVILSQPSLKSPQDVSRIPRQQLPPPPSAYLAGSSRTNVSPRRSAKVTMGDARTEHLLLAAKRVRNMRSADERVGRLTMDELKKGGVIGPEGGVGYSEGYGGPDSGLEDEDSEYEEKILSTRRPSLSARSKGKVPGQTHTQGTPLLPRAKRSGKRHVNVPSLPQTPSKSSRKNHPPPPTTPGGSNFNDLLRAAEMATRPGTPTPEDHAMAPPLSAMSATRSTTRIREDSASERGSPVKRARREQWSSPGVEDTLIATQKSGHASQQSASALDLLAQASQLDAAQSGDLSSVSSSGPLPSAARLGGVLEHAGHRGSSPLRGIEPLLGPAIDLGPFPRHPASDVDELPPNSDASIITPKGRPRTYSNASELATPSNGRVYASSQMYPTPGGETVFEEGTPKTEGSISLASPSGGAVPGLGKYVHLTSSIPARRVRSPYLKWTVEEDELLARAVAIHGEKWDLVSKGVPTRSYHQVRQRWLRKTGAFDKKPSIDEKSTLGETVITNDLEDDQSPTPGGGNGGHKRRRSQL
ncbi:hypothetical protein IAU60_000258 [Kwoniella sp. DSM 27419]